MYYSIKKSPLTYYSYEQKCILIAILQTFDKNSRFIHRLSLVNALLLSRNKFTRKMYEQLDEIIVNGTMAEDPQEHLFSQVVNTPRGSYRVFHGIFEYHLYMLSRLLFLAEKCGITDKMAIGYSLLRLSDTIAERSGCALFEAGDEKAETPTAFIRKEFDNLSKRVTFSRKEIEEIFIECDSFDNLYFKGSNKKIQNDLANDGYSDDIDLFPLVYLTQGRTLVAIPSSLAYCAYSLCVKIFIENIGRDVFLQYYCNEVVNQVRHTLEDKGECVFLLGSEYEGISQLIYQFDCDKYVLLNISLEHTIEHIDEAFAIGESFIKEHLPAGCTIFNILILDSTSNTSVDTSSTKAHLCFQTDDFEAVMEHTHFNIRNLFYYYLERKKILFAPYTQEIDIIGWYLSNNCTFYLDNHYDVRLMEVGLGFSIKKDYYWGRGIHYVKDALKNRLYRLTKVDSLPVSIPLFCVDGEENHFVLESHRHIIHMISEEKAEFYTNDQQSIIHSLGFWIHTFMENGLLSINHKHLFLYIQLDETVSQSQVSITGDIDVNVWLSAEEIFMQSIVDKEQQLLQIFFSLLASMRILQYSPAECFSFRKTSNASILQEVNTDNLLLFNDGEISAATIHKQFSDSVLDEIANFLNRKGTEIVLDKEESIETTCNIINYLKNEIATILSHFNISFLLNKLLTLCHGMLFWKNHVQYRFEKFSAAYQLLGENLSQQLHDVNEYQKTIRIAECLIEFIIVNNIRNEGQDISNLMELERLFALMNQLYGFGNYMDLVRSDMSDCNLTILKNGRVALPTDKLDAINSYMFALRQHSAADQSLVSKLHATIPQLSVDFHGEEFNNVCTTEYGISFFRIEKLCNSIIEYSLEKRQPVFELAETDFRRIFLADLADTQYDQFKAKYFLSSDCACNLKPAETFFQRYNRSVQLSSRPIIIYDGRVLVSYKLVFYSNVVFNNRVNSGIYKASSKKMKNFITEVSHKKGAFFEQRLADYFRSLEDNSLTVFQNISIKPYGDVFAEKDYGDIDVVVVNHLQKVLVLIEAKNYTESHTMNEALTEIRKVREGVRKAEERVSWCRQHIDQLVSSRIQIDQSYSLLGIYLTYYEPVARHLYPSKQSLVKSLSALDIIQNPYVIFEH